MNEKNTTKAPKDRNNVLIQGIIVHKFVTPDVAILTVSTGKATPVTNYPKILFFGKLRDEVEANYCTSDHVKITGNLQSSRRKEHVKNQVMQSIFGETIEFTSSIMEDAYKITSVKNSHKPCANSFVISGKVVRAQNLNSNMIRITLKTQKGKHVSYPKLVYFTYDADKVIEKISDKYICTVGCVQTVKKKAKDSVNHYENYVVLEYEVIDND